MTVDQVGGCRADPTITYDQECVLHITTFIETTPDNVLGISTDVELPSGTLLNSVKETGGPLEHKEILSIRATGKQGQVETETHVRTRQDSVPVTVSISLNDGEPSTETGSSNAYILNSITI